MRMLLLAIVLIFPAVTMGAEPRPMNVLFFAIDDLRPTLGCYGDTVAITPNIDALAARGLRFDRAYCQQAVCNASRQSILSGRRPDSIRVWNMVDHFRKTTPDVVSLPEHFKNHGYFAQSFGKIYHGKAPMNDPQSWSVPETYALIGKADDYALPENIHGGVGPGDKAASYEITDVDDEGYNDGLVAKGAIEALVRIKDRPFFLAVGFRKPHVPFNAPRRYWEMYAPARIPKPDPIAAPLGVPAIALHDSVELRGYTDIPNEGPIDEKTTAILRHGYYAATSYMDAQVGRVMAELDRLKLRERTVVVLWSDHGYHLGEHGLWCKTTNFELDTRVPLIISVPGAASTGKATAALVELVDLYPTLTDLCGLPPGPKLDGRSLRPLIERPDGPWSGAAFSQFPRPWVSGKKPVNMGRTVRTDRFRYVEWREVKTGKLLARELYDHGSDPMETVNVVDRPDMAATVAEHAALLERMGKP